jgi:cytoskeletal protein RodZ
MKTLAEALVNERKKSDITLEQIARKTNINLKALEAMEHGEFKKLPGEFYFKNYIKSYIRAVEGDVEAFFETYGELVDAIASNTVEKPRVSFSKLRYSRFKKRNFIVLLLLFVILVVMAVLYIYYKYGGVR